MQWRCLSYKIKILVLLLCLSFKVDAGEGLASWYGKEFHGKRTAAGEIYNMNKLTAAHNSLPFGTLVSITHDHKQVVVHINDRGNFHKKHRLFDLSKRAAFLLGIKGVSKVNYKVIHK